MVQRSERAGRPSEVVAIDGPAGSGKSTVARRVAAELGLTYLDTGAMYRAVTAAVLHDGIDPHDAAAVAKVAAASTLDVGARVTVDGRDVTVEIRGPEVTASVSAVAANPEVRATLVDQQRAIARRHGGGVPEGRDIGTVVFPDARLKVFLTASAEARAARRATEGTTGTDAAAVAADLARRDRLDASRATSPLAAAEDAVVVDTTDMTIEEVVARVVDLWQQRQERS